MMFEVRMDIEGTSIGSLFIVVAVASHSHFLAVTGRKMIDSGHKL